MKCNECITSAVRLVFTIFRFVKILPLTANLEPVWYRQTSLLKTSKDIYIYSSYVQRKRGIFLQTREDIIDMFARIANRASNNDQLARRLLLQTPQRLYNFDCYEQAVDLFNELCYNLSEVTFIRQFRCHWSLHRDINNLYYVAPFHRRHNCQKEKTYILRLLLCVLYVRQRSHASCYVR